MAAQTPLDVAALLANSSTSTRPSTKVDREDDLTYDLGLLYAFDPSPVDTAAMTAADPSAYLLRTARENMQLLSNKLYELFTSSTDKKMIVLPPPTTHLPREKPLPEAKPLTRWEKFAKEKGIVKKKRSKMVWDEEKQQWAPRYGYGRANDPKDKMKDWLVMAKPGDDGSVDPFEAKADERKMRLSKQKKQEERNRLEAAHAASFKGAKGMAKADQRKYLDQAISAVQVSTASAGRFDKTVAHEPSKDKGKRKQYESATGGDVQEKDSARAQKVYAKMFPDTKQSLAVDRGVAAKQVKATSLSPAHAATAHAATARRRDSQRSMFASVCPAAGAPRARGSDPGQKPPQLRATLFAAGGRAL